VRWLMLLILFVVRLAMGFQFQSVASTSAQLVETFGLSYAQIGTLIGFFLLPGVFISIPSGALTRTVSDKNLLMAGALRDATASAKAPVLLAALLMVIVVACILLLRVLQLRWPILRSR